jgi:hypothetical protein
MSPVPSLESLVGSVVGMRVPIVHLENTIHAKIHRVESSGLWIESAEITDLLLTAASKTAAPRTLILFFPFSQIDFVTGYLDVPSLSEKIARPQSQD